MLYEFIKSFIRNRTSNYIIFVLIITNVQAVMPDSVSWINRDCGEELYLFEAISVFVFTVEYFARIMAHKKKSIKYIFSLYAIVDLIAIVPFFILSSLLRI